MKSDFDPTHDYFEDLKDSEKYTEKGGNREYPYLRGLQRIAHSNRGGVKEILSHIVKAPSVDSDGEDTPDCIAAVTVTYVFKDGTSFAGSADASYKAVEHPVNLHLTAVADSKAEARAIRRAFAISKVSKEEIGDAQFIEYQEDSVDDKPISDQQIQGIKRVAKRKELGQADVIQLLKLKDPRAAEVNDINDLNRAEAAKAMRLINKYKQKK